LPRKLGSASVYLLSDLQREVEFGTYVHVQCILSQNNSKCSHIGKNPTSLLLFLLPRWQLYGSYHICSVQWFSA